MSKELEKAQHAIRELTVEMSGTEYEEFMRQLAEWGGLSGRGCQLA